MVTIFDVFKEGLVSFSLAATGTREIYELKDLLDATVHLYWCFTASAISLSAGPTALHIDASFTVEAIAVLALEWEWANDEVA